MYVCALLQSGISERNGHSVEMAFTHLGEMSLLVTSQRADLQNCRVLVQTKKKRQPPLMHIVRKHWDREFICILKHP